MGFIEGILIGILPVLLIVIYLLNERISNLNKALTMVVKETEQHFKEIDYAMLSVAQSLQMLSEAMVATSKSGAGQASAVLAERLGKLKTVSEQFLKLKKITDEQMALFGTTQSPSASASHSKHKNSIVRKIQALEKEKRVVMQSILDAGVDPEITTIDDSGNQKTMKLSEAMKLQPIEDIKDTPPKTDSKSPRKKDGNIISLFDKGDKDDEDDKDPTLH